MALQFDTRHRPARPGDWKALLEAVLEATPEDESISLEFKSDINLSDDASLAWSIARTILGFANRSVEDANRHFDGSGVLIVGLEPQNISGVVRLDPAVLDQKLSRFIGEDGPAWEPRYFNVDGKDVLIVEVYAPRFGDRIFALRKTFEVKSGARSRTIPIGTVWRRRGGRTVPAAQADFDMLHRRAQAKSDNATLTLEVSCTPAVVSPFHWSQSNVENWLNGRRNVLLQSLADFKRTEASASPFPIINMALGELRNETRTESQFVAQVDAWIADLAEKLKVMPVEFGRLLGVAPRFEVRNPTEVNFSEVVVRFSMEGAVSIHEAADESPYLEYLLPVPPRKFGPYRKPLIPSALVSSYDIGRSIQPANSVRPQTQRQNGGSFVMKTLPVNLRPGETEVVEMESVILVPAERTEALTMRWSATATNVNGSAQGELQLGRNEPLDLWSAFLDACEEQEWP